MLDIIKGPFKVLFSGSAPSSHMHVKGDPRIGPAIPWCAYVTRESIKRQSIVVKHEGFRRCCKGSGGLNAYLVYYFSFFPKVFFHSRVIGV